MMLTGRGLVVRQTKYGDHKSVVNVYTDIEGMRAFMVRVGSRSGGKMRSSFFLPLSQIEFSYDRKSVQSETVPFLREVKLAYAYRSLYSDIYKSGMALFMAEVMSRCLTEPLADGGFFNRLWTALRDFDAREEGFADFHLFFLLEIALLLGVYPQKRQGASEKYFDLREGGFSSTMPAHNAFAMEPAVSDLESLMESYRVQGMNACMHFTRERRATLLKVLADYCRLQAQLAADFHSLEILRGLY